MFAYAAIPLTCWLAAFLAVPRKPLPGNEIEELVYSRLLGRQHLLRLLALIVTMFMLLGLVISLPSRMDPTLRTHRVCTDSPVGFPTCYNLQSSDTWAQEELDSDGTWHVVAIVSRPPLTEKDRALQGP
jgi:hypothetical protein